jgi:hypothetical protein
MKNSHCHHVDIVEDGVEKYEVVLTSSGIILLMAFKK